MRILSIDFGQKRIGLAISDENQILALPLENALAGKTDEKTIENILALLGEKKEQIGKILIGLPLHLNGQESPMSAKVRSFAEKMEKALSLPVELFDERFSSECAHTSLKEINVSRKKRAKKIDSLSALIILQNYLERRAFSCP